MESMNAELIKSGIEPTDRMEKLNKMAISQMKVLIKSSLMAKLK